MPENKIGELVRIAKGEDRSLREYARCSGVDAAVISKIINGSYIPKNIGVYKKLASLEASPRGGVTYKKLVEAANSSESYQKGLAAGMGMLASESVLAAIGGLPMAALSVWSIGIATVATNIISGKKKGDANRYKKIVNEVEQFITISNGLLYSGLAANGISFRVISTKSDETEKNRTNTFLELVDQEVSEYDFRYAYISEEHCDKQTIEGVFKNIMGELVLLKPSTTKKVSIVTNSLETYEHMASFKDGLSYNGELSIVLVDMKAVKLVKEEYIAHNTEGNALDEMKLL